MARARAIGKIKPRREPRWQKGPVKSKGRDKHRVVGKAETKVGRAREGNLQVQRQE